MIALDTTALGLLFIPKAEICHPGTTNPIKHAKERLEALVEKMAKNGETILVPTPVLSELIVRIPADQVNDLLTQMNTSTWFRVEAFDSAAAVELGLKTAKAIAAGDKREGLTSAPWTKVKFDRQIVAIAIVNQASEIISEDPDVRTIGTKWGIKVSSIADLPIPSEFIPPPLLAGLDDETDNEKDKSIPSDIRRSGDAPSEDQAPAKAAKGQAQDNPDSNEEEIANLDLSKEFETETNPPSSAK